MTISITILCTINKIFPSLDSSFHFHWRTSTGGLPLEDFRGIGKCLGNVGCPRFRHEPSRDIPIPKTVATASSSFFSFGIQRTEKEERREKRKKREERRREKRKKREKEEERKGRREKKKKKKEEEEKETKEPESLRRR